MREEGAQWLNRLTHFYKREIYPPNLQYQELKEGTLRAFAKVRRAGEVLPIRRKNNWYFSGVEKLPFQVSVRAVYQPIEKDNEESSITLFEGSLRQADGTPSFKLLFAPLDITPQRPVDRLNDLENV